MHVEPKVFLKQAVQKCLPTLQSLLGSYQSPHLVWKQTGETQWNSEWQLLPDIGKVFIIAQTKIDTAAEPFVESFFKHYPEYKGMVGFPQFGFKNFEHDRTFILRYSLSYLWILHRTFDVSESVIDKLVNEFEDFLDGAKVRLLFRSMLLNFNSPSEKLIELPEGLKIRRLSESEISDLRGGSMESMMFRREVNNMQDFCIEGEIEENKSVGYSEGNYELSEIDYVKEKLDKAMLCLRTFKAGYVGYDSIQYIPATFCPLIVGSHGYGNLYVPFGRYEIKSEEIRSLEEHAKLIFGINEEAMRMACSRLADAEHRTSPYDRIVDAVIGMEALLLSSINDRQGELSFRFSLNYAMLFPPEQRQSAFKFARDIYGLRSKIAHGSFIGNECKIDGEKVNPLNAANKSTAALREIILTFLKKRDTSYKKPEFWQRQYFGLPDMV